MLVGSSRFSHSIHEAPKHRVSSCTEPFENDVKRLDDGRIIC